jgi:ATP-dependent Zn protease
MTDPRVRELVATAYHEAGHAVMATILGRNIQKVTIKAGQIQTGGIRLGACELAIGRRRSSHDALEDEVLILLAGMVAEAKFTGHYCPLGASQDLRHAANLLQDRAGSEDQTQRLQKRMLDKTEHLLGSLGHSQAIKNVAIELIDRTTISGRAVRHIVNQSISQNR